MAPLIVKSYFKPIFKLKLISNFLETLNFLIGQKEEDVKDDIKKVLMGMGKNIIYCGEVGHGQIAKMCNNMAMSI